VKALDSNVIVRFLVRDDERQARLVYDRFKQAESTREVLVVLEMMWVLESTYDRPREEILDSLDELKGMPILEFEDVQVLQNLLEEGRKSRVDLSDLLIAFAAQSRGCSEGITFDKSASKFSFFRLLA